jgi:hypothetical protein
MRRVVLRHVQIGVIRAIMGLGKGALGSTVIARRSRHATGKSNRAKALPCVLLSDAGEWRAAAGRNRQAGNAAIFKE